MTNPFANILFGLSRVIGSAKVQNAARAEATAFITAWFATRNASPDVRAAAFMAAAGLGCLLAKACIDGWTAEDVATSAAAAPVAPQTVVAAPTGDHASVSTTTATPDNAVAAPVPPKPAAIPENGIAAPVPPKPVALSNPLKPNVGQSLLRINPANPYQAKP